MEIKDTEILSLSKILIKKVLKHLNKLHQEGLIKEQIVSNLSFDSETIRYIDDNKMDLSYLNLYMIWALDKSEDYKKFEKTISEFPQFKSRMNKIGRAHV